MKHVNWGRAVLAGLVGTAVMTIVAMMAGPMIGIEMAATSRFLTTTEGGSPAPEPPSPSLSNSDTLALRPH